MSAVIGQRERHMQKVQKNEDEIKELAARIGVYSSFKQLCNLGEQLGALMAYRQALFGERLS